MRDEPLPTVSDLRGQAKQLSGQTFDTDEQCFLDAFQHGEFHEEDTEFVSITDRLSDQELASLYLPVCRAMISSSGKHREGPSLKTLMACYASLAKWERRHLDNPDEILRALKEVRELLFADVIAEHATWWSDVLRHLEMIEIGVRRRMGVSHFEIDSIYRDIDYKLSKS